MSLLAALTRRRTWLTLRELVATYRHCREQRRRAPVDLQAAVEMSPVCPHLVEDWRKCGLCTGLGWR